MKGIFILGLHLLLLALVSQVSGCKTHSRVLPQTAPYYVSLPNGRDPMDPDRIAPLLKDMPDGLLHYIQSKRPGSLDILEISGGAQNGAFGAGVLAGWNESGTRPEFDIVTGISVGALLATHAFLGTREDDAVLGQIFTNMTQKDVIVRRRLVRMWNKASIFDSAPLAKLIAQHIDMQTLNRVADQSERGRRLVVGAVNLDTKQIWVFDLTVLARERTEEALEKFRKILLAASSPPVAMPPVFIDGFYFVDGGIRDRLLVAGLSDWEAVENRSEYEPSPGTVYVIYNDKMVPDIEAMKPNIGGVLSSSIRVMLNGQMETTLVRSYVMARLEGMEFRLQLIPEHFKLSDDPLAFDQELMAELYKLGSDRGGSSEEWLDQPPPTQNLTPWGIEVLNQLKPKAP